MFNQNRPISPHLTVYNPQKSSVFSIWHRISGFVMFNLISGPVLFLKFLTFSGMKTNFFLDKVVSYYLVLKWVSLGFFTIISVIFLYHIINGIRHFWWDSAMHVNTKQINKDSNLLLAWIFAIVFLRFFLSY